MKAIQILFLATLFSVTIANFSFGQCVHDPRVTGDTLLCPNANGLLTTQSVDAYQWYKRAYGSGTTTLVAGANSQTLSIGPNDVLYYFSVDATLGGCTERSPEALVDGWVFLLPYVISSGDFTTGGNGEAIICTGDTMYLTMGSPYDTLISWYRNGNLIAGADSSTLVVTTAGSYTSQGAPGICPNFLQQLGLNIDVVEINCGVGLQDDVTTGISIFPNPADEWVTIQAPEGDWVELTIVDQMGRLVVVQPFVGSTDRVWVGNLPSGMFWVNLKNVQGGTKRMGLFVR